MYNNYSYKLMSLFILKKSFFLYFNIFYILVIENIMLLRVNPLRLSLCTFFFFFVELAVVSPVVVVTP